MSLEHWESYYQSGALATGPASPSGGYDQELRSVWKEFLSPLPNEATILDLGTGNGALALIVKELGDAQDFAWTIHGTDLATIDPPRQVANGRRRFEGVIFHSGVASEELPFDDASFDAVCGQYALEYADSSRAVPEVARILKPGGRAQFVMHHDRSLLAENARQSLLQASLVLQVTQVYDALRRVVNSSGQAPEFVTEATATFRSAMRRLGRAQTEFLSGGTEIISVTLAALRELLSMRSRYSSEELLAEINRVEGDLKFATQRVKDLLAHASDEAAVNALIELAQRSGLECTERALQHHAEEKLVGWRLQFTRVDP